MGEPCKSYRSADRICADGFIQLPACSGDACCWSCGAPSKIQPYCLRDELPEHWLTDGGEPVFYSRAALAEHRRGK